MRFIELLIATNQEKEAKNRYQKISALSPEEGYNYQVNVDHIVYFYGIEVNDIERTVVKLIDGQIIQVSQTVKEIYNAL